MVWLIVVVLVVVLLVAVVAFVALVLRRRSTAVATAPTHPVVPPPPVDEPMTGLEAALARITDRDGRPIRERIDAEQQHVDDLRVPDDTGPLLRRALDHVEQPGAVRSEAATTPPVGTD